MSIAPLVALGTLVFTFVNFLRFLAARNWSAVLTQAIAWAAGVLGVFLMKATDFASGIKVGSQSLDKVGFWSALLLGLLAILAVEWMSSPSFWTTDNLPPSRSQLRPTLDAHRTPSART